MQKDNHSRQSDQKTHPDLHALQDIRLGLNGLGNVRCIGDTPTSTRQLADELMADCRQTSLQPAACLPRERPQEAQSCRGRTCSPDKQPDSTVDVGVREVDIRCSMLREREWKQGNVGASANQFADHTCTGMCAEPAAV